MKVTSRDKRRKDSILMVCPLLEVRKVLSMCNVYNLFISPTNEMFLQNSTGQAIHFIIVFLSLSTHVQTHYSQCYYIVGRIATILYHLMVHGA